MVRPVVFALAQLGSMSAGLLATACEGCPVTTLLPVITTELPWMAVTAQTRADPVAALGGVAGLAATCFLVAVTARWLAVGGRVGGAVVLAGWLGWWTVAAAFASVVHAEAHHCCLCLR